MERIEIEGELAKVMGRGSSDNWSSSFSFEDLWVLVTEGRTLIQVGDEETKVYNSCLDVSSRISISNEEHLVWADIRFSFYGHQSGPEIVYSSRIEKQNSILDATEFYDAVWSFIDNGESFKGDEGYSQVLEKAIKAGPSRFRPSETMERQRSICWKTSMEEIRKQIPSLEESGAGTS